MEPDACALVCDKGEWICDDSWRFDGNSLKEVQDVVAIVYDGGQRLDGGQICLTWFRNCVLGLNGDDAIFFIGLVCLTCGVLFLCPLRDGAGENLEELARIRLAVEDCGLRQKWREEDCVAGSLVSLFLGSREVAGGGPNKDLRDQ